MRISKVYQCPRRQLQEVVVVLANYVVDSIFPQKVLTTIEVEVQCYKQVYTSRSCNL